MTLALSCTVTGMLYLTPSFRERPRFYPGKRLGFKRFDRLPNGIAALGRIAGSGDETSRVDYPLYSVRDAGKNLRRISTIRSVDNSGAGDRLPSEDARRLLR